MKDENGELIPKKVAVWNPTVANLTLMALGSSAPEILLSVIETCTTLGKTPGELGPSTIVGSAAFNFLVISGVSIYAVNEKSDNRTEDEIVEDNCPRGTKKIQDLGVFAITATWSVVAYCWLYWVLKDQQVEMWEAITTFAFFWVLLIMAFVADKINQKKMKSRIDGKFGLKEGQAGTEAVTPYKYVDFYKTLIPHEQGAEPKNEEEAAKAEQMKAFLLKEFGTAKVSAVDADALKKKLEGDNLIERITYRKAVNIASQPVAIKKGQVLRRENVMATMLSESQRSNSFCFPCLHYTVSEGAGYLLVKVKCVSDNMRQVRVRTIDAEATAPKDYEAIDEILTFEKKGEEKNVKIAIVDDEQWEPDEDFYVELCHPDTNERIEGEDTQTRVTIVDDDRPGVLQFANQTSFKHPANEKDCRVTVLRQHDSDGQISVKYKTVQLDQSSRTATPGVDYTHVEGVLTFEHRECEKDIIIPVLQKELKEGEERNEMFGVKIFGAEPIAVKISKKDTAMVEIVTDAKAKRQQDALSHLLKKIQDQEEITWRQQFINATLLHPTKNEEGNIEEVSGGAALMHFLCIGWKFIFAACPPAHIWGGWACFLVALTFIGIITAIVGEVANLMGCVVGLKPGVTAITFVAVGTSLPDTFASMTAAKESRYADSAVGNVTGSNSVNVFLGLGLPWIIAAIYSKNNNEVYQVPASGLSLSVMLFLVCTLTGLLVLIIRRVVVKGELGGSPGGRLASAIFFVTLWLIYVVISTLAQYKIITVDI